MADPDDLATFAEMLAGLLGDPVEAERMGRNGQIRASEDFLSDRHLEQWADLLARIL